MDQTDQKIIKVGISSCLLGENVRYNGGHKLDRYLRDTLGTFVEYVPVCPEVECGLPIPREPMHLEGHPDAPRLITTNTRIDHTEKMLTWARNRLEELAGMNLCGFIFKTRSPSSGLRNIKIFNGDSIFQGKGLFAGAFLERFPLLPVEDDGRLHDPVIRENFIQSLFLYHRWQVATASGFKPGNLVNFHTRHKLLIMAHSPARLYELGRIVADQDKNDPGASFKLYFHTLLEILQEYATVKKNTNVLHHIMGYFKQDLSGDEKTELLEIIEQYRQELVPLIVPIVLLNHYVRKYDQDYLKQQYYLNPHPLELKLRNHV